MATLDFAIGDGATTGFDLPYPWKSQTTPSVYINDWQGLQLQYATARTNILAQSQGFDTATWGKNQCTATADSATAPDGTSTAEVITANAGATNTYVAQTNGTSNMAGQTISFSVYIKQGTIVAGTGVMLWLRDGVGSNIANSIFNISTGDLATQGTGSAATQNMGNGWFRWTVSGTFPGGAAVGWQCIVDPIGTPVAGETYYVWGAQMEAASVATSYIRTTSTPVTVTDYSITSTRLTFAVPPLPGANIRYAYEAIPFLYGENKALYNLL